jgi:glycosyltransferase involved in cell wall biosynthesis
MRPKPVRVLFDDQIFLLQRTGGISKSFVELASALDGREDTQASMQARVSINEHLRDSTNSRLPNVSVVGIGRLERPLHAINRRLARRGPFDVVHHTYYRAGRLPDVDPGRSISTVHDMIPEDFPEMFPLGNPHDAKIEFLRRSAGIVCVSNAALARLRAHVDLSGRPVAVVHHGVRPDLQPGSVPLLDLPERFVLHVGRRDGPKYGGDALRAFSALAQDDRTVRLVLVGGGPLTEPERELLPDADRVVCLMPSDAQMPGIYAQALAFVSASISEGFGMPLLEAMASGCPIVVAENEAYLEVAQEAGYFFAARDVEACADALAEAIGRGSATSNRVRFGLKRSQEWTWAKAAAELREFYLQVLAG